MGVCRDVLLLQEGMITGNDSRTAPSERTTAEEGCPKVTLKGLARSRKAAHLLMASSDGENFPCGVSPALDLSTHPCLHCSVVPFLWVDLRPKPSGGVPANATKLMTGASGRLLVHCLAEGRGGPSVLFCACNGR